MKNKKVNCAVIGATGFTGIELIKILVKHPSVQLVALTTRKKTSMSIHKLIPGLSKRIKLKLETYSFEKVQAKADLVFLCLPHTEAAQTGAKFLKAGKIVIDLSADFRLKDPKDYQKWYKINHSQKALLKKAVYGLPEFFRSKVKKANLIANPGCYPTATVLGIAPLIKEGIVDSKSIVVDAKSGYSGAGKKFVTSAAFKELPENFYAYKVGRHQHTPEIHQAVYQATGKKMQASFVTHLLPVERGILATIYLKVKKGTTIAKVKRAFEKAYKKEPFVRIKGEGIAPTLKGVQHTNYCDIGYVLSDDRLIVMSAIDNLVKGASGQAVQNMNIRLGFSEKKGFGSK